MRFGVLGPLAVWKADGSLLTVPGLKTRALLAALLAHEGHPVSADRLVDEVWGAVELPGNPAAALQTRIWQLRKVFGDAEAGGRELLTLRDDGYLLRTEPGSVDMGRFQALVVRAGAADAHRGRVALLTEALGLWRGTPFSGFEDADFARPVVTRLEEARLAAVEALVEVRIDLGEHFDVAGEPTELVVRHPLRERLRALQMRALYAAGRAGEALAGYQQLRLEGLAGAHALAGRPAYATLLLGAADAARESVAMPLPAAERGDVDRIATAVRVRLDEEAYRDAYRRGRGLSPEQALAADRTSFRGRS